MYSFIALVLSFNVSTAFAEAPETLPRRHQQLSLKDILALGEKLPEKTECGCTDPVTKKRATTMCEKDKTCDCTTPSSPKCNQSLLGRGIMHAENCFDRACHRSWNLKFDSQKNFELKKNGKNIFLLPILNHEHCLYANTQCLAHHVCINPFRHRPDKD